MNYGKWFTLDFETSDLKNGLAFFNYRGFKFYKKEAIGEYETENDGEKNTPVYPIFATINSNGVHFYCHYALCSPSIDSNKNGLIYHQDNAILSLDFSGNKHTNGDFHHRINDAFCAVYPRLKNPINKNTGKKFFEQFEEQIFKNIEQVENEKGITYSSLDVFWAKRIGEDETVTEYNHFVVRKLFLDFIYDIEHTDVFQNSPHFEKVYDCLHNDFLFKAIASKAEFYYHRRICENLFYGDMTYDNMGVLLVNFEHYVQSERNWVECILNPRADKLFYDSNWISSTKKELDDIYTSNETCADLFEKLRIICIGEDYNNRVYELSKTINSSAEKAHSWYIRKYDLGGSLYVLFGERNPILWVVMCIPVFFPIARRLVSKRRTTRFIGCIEMFMPRMFAAIFAAWFSLYSFVERYLNVGYLNNQTSRWIVLGIVATVILMFAFLYSEIKRKTLYTFVDHKTDIATNMNFETTILRRVSCILIIGFEYSVLISMFIYKTAKLDGDFMQILFSILVVMFVGIFVQMIFDEKSVSESFK